VRACGSPKTGGFAHAHYLPTGRECNVPPRPQIAPNRVNLPHSSSFQSFGFAMLFLDAATFRAWASGRQQGPIASLLRMLAGCAEPVTAWYVARRNARFDSGRNPSERVAAPVISVGNLTVGGTGKTPFVAWLAEWFRQRQVPVTLISRGYGKQGAGPNDEARELALRLPDVPHVQNPDRVAAAKGALKNNPQQVLILDDAFQHRRIARDLEIVLLDALDPFGCDHLLPRGLLREPPRSLRRADVVALSRADAISAAERMQIRARVAELAPQAMWLEVTHRPTALVSTTGERLPLSWLAGRKIAAFCGLGNPAGFEHTLQSTGAVVAHWQAFPDHCPYSPQQVQQLERWLRTADCDAVVCTLKDLVKLPYESLAEKRLWGLAIELEFLSGCEELTPLLAQLVERVVNQASNSLHFR